MNEKELMDNLLRLHQQLENKPTPEKTPEEPKPLPTVKAENKPRTPTAEEIDAMLKNRSGKTG